MTETTLRNIDYTLMAAGGLVSAVALLRWWLTPRYCRQSPAANAGAARSSPGGAAEKLECTRIKRDRAGYWDPLRGSPLRTNRMGLTHVWLCIAVMLLAWGIGSQIAGWIAPAGLTGNELQNWEGIFAANLAAVLNAVTCLVIARFTFAGGLRGFGIGRRRGGYEIAVGVAGWLAALSITGVILIITQWIIVRFFPRFQPPEHGVFQALRDPAMRPWMQTFAAVGAFALVPVGEELLFRGILQTGMQKVVPARFGSLRHRWAAILITGALFGAVHSTTPQFIPALIALGVLLGFLYERTGSIIVPIVVHMLFNGKSLLWDYLARIYVQSQ